MPYYTREGYQLYYFHEGQGHPVVFIHGYLGSSRSHWGPQLDDPVLSSQFELIAPDLRGFANSSLGKLVEKNRTEDHLLDLHTLLNSELKLTKKPFFIGYSIGGTLALMYELKYPGSAQGIFLVSPRPFLHKTTRAWNFLAKEKRSGEKKKRSTSFLWIIVKRFQKFFSFLHTKRNRKTSKEYLNQLSELDIPILMVHGNKDTVNPKIAFETLKEYLPKAKVIEFNGDHGITHEHPEEFNKLLIEFLKENTLDYE